MTKRGEKLLDFWLAIILVVLVAAAILGAILIIERGENYRAELQVAAQGHAEAAARREVHADRQRFDEQYELTHRLP